VREEICGLLDYFLLILLSTAQYRNAAYLLREAGVTATRAVEVLEAQKQRLTQLNELMSHNLTENPGENHTNHAVMMLHMKNESSPLAASTEWDGGVPEIERNMEGAFPGLTMAIKLQGTTIAALGKRFMRTNFLILGAISVLLALGESARDAQSAVSRAGSTVETAPQSDLISWCASQQ